MSQEGQGTAIPLGAAAERTGLDVEVVRHCVRVGLVTEPLRDKDLAELRRVRRLTALEVDLAGVEIIVRMRRRIESLQAEIVRLHGHRETL
jgi:DNA-binding transcriptional MerR regulator